MVDTRLPPTLQSQPHHSTPQPASPLYRSLRIHAHSCAFLRFSCAQPARILGPGSSVLIIRRPCASRRFRPNFGLKYVLNVFYVLNISCVKNISNISDRKYIFFTYNGNNVFPVLLRSSMNIIYCILFFGTSKTSCCRKRQPGDRARFLERGVSDSFLAWLRTACHERSEL